MSVMYWKLPFPGWPLDGDNRPKEDIPVSYPFSIITALLRHDVLKLKSGIQTKISNFFCCVCQVTITASLNSCTKNPHSENRVTLLPPESVTHLTQVTNIRKSILSFRLFQLMRIWHEKLHKAHFSHIGTAS